MAQRIYWVPHTVCTLGCEHCHNDSNPLGHPGSKETLDSVVGNLPDPGSPSYLEEILLGGGEPLLDGPLLEYAIRCLRGRFPKGPRSLSVSEKRRAGYLVIAIQTNGLSLADGKGHLLQEKIDFWLDVGIDYFQVASGDKFHQSRMPDYPWPVLFDSMNREMERGIYFRVYGKPSGRLVPSGRVLENLSFLEQQGAEMLLEPNYCANGWETASNWMHPEREYPDCSEIVIDEYGVAHPCCWYRISPPLFDLKSTSFATGMETAGACASYRMLDRGDICGVGTLAGMSWQEAMAVRDAVGDCGACRLFFLALAKSGLAMPREAGAWMHLNVHTASAQERAYYTERLPGHFCTFDQIG